MWRELSWDTEFFGIAIGSIDLAGATPDAIDAAEHDARRAGIACLYAETGVDDPSIVALQRKGYRLMEIALDLDHATSRLSPPRTDAVVRTGTTADTAALEPHVRTLAPWSRFAIDPRFGAEVTLSLYRAWVLRAAAGTDGRRLMIAEASDGIVGFATTSSDRLEPGRSGCRHRIDLIASTAPSSGAAQALVAAAFARFGPGRSAGGPIAARNVASLRFSEHMGYRVAAAVYRFHRWLDEDECR